MQWSAVEYDALLRFLANVGSQDPAVQRSNIVQLQHMAHWCAAPYALLDVLCGSERAPSLRQASGLVLKQLIQINPSLVQELNIKVMENTLLGALSDANTIVCRSASLVVAAIVNGGDRFEDRWPGLLQMLRDRASEMHRRSVQGGDPGAIDEAVRHISGVASCARIICEECGLTLRELVTSNEGMCACFFELFCHLLHAAAAVVFNEGDPNRLSLVVESVLSSVTCCITEAVFCVDETEMDEFPHHEGTMQIPQHVLSGALAVHRTACAFIHHAFAVSSGHTLLACIVGYLNCVLQWSKFGWDCTLLAVEEVLPHVLRRMCTGGAEDEQILVLCLNFITNVASCSAATLSHVAKGVAAAIFHCGAVACLLAESFSDECISRVPYTEANLRPLTPGERASILDSGLEEGMDDISSDASQSSETATSLQQSLVHTIEVMSNTCYDDLVGYLIPLITPAMVPGNHPDAQPLRSQETALFLFTELADELFEGLNSELVLSIAAYCWEVLSSNPLPPVNLRRHAVRCVARMATGCAANSWNDDTACPNTLSISSVLRLVSGVVLGDPSHRIQVDGIRCVSMVLPYVFDKHKEGIDEDITVTSLFLVVQNLLSKLPSMSLEARSATYRCLSEIFSLTASRKERWLTTINELTMQTISLLGARAEHIAAELSCSKTQGSSVATALELIALLNATVDVVNSASEDILIQKVGPLVNLAATLLSFCTAQEDETVEGNPNTFRGLYGSDISTLVLDMLDACCSTLLSEEELLCGTEASAQKFLFLRNIMGVGGSGDSSRVLDLCFELLGKGGVREKEVELRRSSFAFMSSALFLCCGQAGTLLEMYRLCIAETACNPHAEKAISNAFLCLAKLFYHLLLEADTDTTSLFCASVSMQDFQPLQEALQLFLVTTSTRTNSYVKTNAFGCAVALAALHQVAYCRPNVAHELYPLLDFSLCAFFRGTEADTCDRYRALMLFALLVSCEREDQQAQQKEKWSLFLPTIGNVLESFERSAPATLTSEVARRWMDILGHAH
ncbi:hypothetical protein ERJ75_000355800 [Trypanosoma vivax]|uniref:Importin N-terminal domain-containing protein n=1 Tax=Trypanosoma vivax (strain Y486) TaxID=1055687 RepID=G0TZY9_TRYVY|nr:hypothetical protein ERJ75_000355800 [Trypanosoma vivax]CCC50169.1 conserved hypothetical protein [Trypanosoma vivax Y486]